MIKAETKKDHSPQITLEPQLEAGGRYVGVVLKWIGDRMYQHAALVRSASAAYTVGLGVLRSAFYITKPWQGPSVDCLNVLNSSLQLSAAMLVRPESSSSEAS